MAKGVLNQLIPEQAIGKFAISRSMFYILFANACPRILEVLWLNIFSEMIFRFSASSLINFGCLSLNKQPAGQIMPKL